MGSSDVTLSESPVAPAASPDREAAVTPSPSPSAEDAVVAAGESDGRPAGPARDPFQQLAGGAEVVPLPEVARPPVRPQTRATCSARRPARPGPSRPDRGGAALRPRRHRTRGAPGPGYHRPVPCASGPCAPPGSCSCSGRPGPGAPPGSRCPGPGSCSSTPSGTRSGPCARAVDPRAAAGDPRRGHRHPPGHHPGPQPRRLAHRH